MRVLLSAVDAQRYLGINAATVRSWAHRGRLYSYGLDAHDRPMYDVCDLTELQG